MNKLLTSILLLGCLLSTAPTSWADDEFDDDDDFPIMKKNDSSRERIKEQRLKNYRWKIGYVLPLHYRSEAYKTDYRQEQLIRPHRKQQWYKVNNTFILVNTETNQILQVNEK